MAGHRGEALAAEAALPHVTYYRCHVGHQFGPQSLAAAKAETAEAKLWAAVAALEETAALARHLAAEPGDDLADQGNDTVKWAADLADTVRSQMSKVPDADLPHQRHSTRCSPRPRGLRRDARP